jgi:hypothetical protein
MLERVLQLVLSVAKNLLARSSAILWEDLSPVFSVIKRRAEFNSSLMSSNVTSFETIVIESTPQQLKSLGSRNVAVVFALFSHLFTKAKFMGRKLHNLLSTRR